MLCVDSEGLGDRLDPSYDFKLLTLTSLLSSHVIYYFKTKLGREDFEKLSFVPKMSETIHFSQETKRSPDKIKPE